MTTATPLALPARVPERVGGYASDDWPALPPLSTLVNRVHCMDCLEFMALLPERSINAIITDLPYGTTACSWDEIIPFAPMWEQVKRILKPRGVFVTTASEPFASLLRVSNLEWFKYDWVWDKVNSASGLLADIMPLKIHENTIVFGEPNANYYPQMTLSKQRIDKPRIIPNGDAFSGSSVERVYNNNGVQFPRSIIKYSNADQTDKQHPTQKPVELYEYLVRTYTQPGELVLDFTCGSGTTLLAARNENRDYIGVDITPEYVEIANKRLSAPFTPSMFSGVLSSYGKTDTNLPNSQLDLPLLESESA